MAAATGGADRGHRSTPTRCQSKPDRLLTHSDSVHRRAFDVHLLVHGSIALALGEMMGRAALLFASPAVSASNNLPTTFARRRHHPGFDVYAITVIC